MNRVIITGWSEGLWFELSKLFLKKWFEVLCLSRNKPDIDVFHLKTDLSDEWSINQAVEVIKKDFSSFKYLIHCAGVLNVDDLWEIDYKELGYILKTGGNFI
jgi:NAD(P)-dependent dehydrogenase (short-subunit alcohol dehydrogenase family)